MKRRVVFGAWLIAWLLVLYVGIDICLDSAAHKVSGYPDPVKLSTYVLIPGLFVIANIVLIACARKLPFPLLFTAFVVQLIGLPAFIFYGSGGV